MKYPPWVHHELMNWSRWCWQGAYPHPMPPTQCGSVEGGYRDHGESASDDGGQSSRVRPNEDRAKIVDRIWRGMPIDQKRIIRAEYPARGEHDWSFGRVGVARQMRIPFREYEAALFAGVEKVWREFERVYR